MVKDTKIVCFGEMLWDILPTEKHPGGAPMNVAIHLKYNGLAPIIISKVGDDDLGEGLLQFLRDKGIPQETIQISSNHDTGVVNANISDKNEVSYEIVAPVAWDYIEANEVAENAVASADVFVYGSLSARNEVSLNTLSSLLEQAKFKVFDVNFRPPHYTQETVGMLLKHADIVKMNHNELEIVMGWYGNYEGDEQSMRYLTALFSFELFILTRGERGAAVLARGQFFEHPGYKVEVADTIGSGDAFLASFLSNYLNDRPVEVCLEHACKVGALVATKEGATPFIGPEALANLG